MIDAMGVYNFNPRSPRGERQLLGDELHTIGLFQSTLSARRATTLSNRVVLYTYRFQSTLSARRATRQYSFPGYQGDISIHALREESDLRTNLMPTDTVNFNPRSPRGERLTNKFNANRHCKFQSTLSARRATESSLNSTIEELPFQSTLSARRATQS